MKFQLNTVRITGQSMCFHSLERECANILDDRDEGNSLLTRETAKCEDVDHRDDRRDWLYCSNGSKMPDISRDRSSVVLHLELERPPSSVGRTPDGVPEFIQMLRG